MKLALVLLVAATTTAQAGPCRLHGRMHGFAPLVLTPAGAKVDQLGGVVIVASETLGDDAPWSDVSIQAYHFLSGGRRSLAKVTALAPGLALYQPVRPAADIDLEDVPGHIALHATFRAIPVRDAPAAPAPEIKGITYTTNVPRFRTEQTIATLTSAPPAGTIAIVVYDAKDRPRSFALIDDPTRTSIEISMRDRCKPEIPGTVPTRAGDRVTLAWVDATGHLSVRSAVISVGRQ